MMPVLIQNIPKFIAKSDAAAIRKRGEPTGRSSWHENAMVAGATNTAVRPSPTATSEGSATVA